MGEPNDLIRGVHTTVRVLLSTGNRSRPVLADSNVVGHFINRANISPTYTLRVHDLWVRARAEVVIINSGEARNTPKGDLIPLRTHFCIFTFRLGRYKDFSDDEEFALKFGKKRKGGYNFF